MVLVKDSRFMRMERVADALAAVHNPAAFQRKPALACCWNRLWLGQDMRGFNVFGYITLRTVLAAMTALAISLRRSRRHPLAGRQEDRPGGTRRRSADAPPQGRHAPPWAAR